MAYICVSQNLAQCCFCMDFKVHFLKCTVHNTNKVKANLKSGHWLCQSTHIRFFKNDFAWLFPNVILQQHKFMYGINGAL